MDNSDDKARGRRQRDFDDLENERAGRNNGRIKRFFPAPDGSAAEAGAKDAAGLAYVMVTLRQVELRLQEQIDEAALAAARALEEVRQRELAAQARLDEIRRTATRTEDGRTVYRTADGTRAFDEDGNELTPEDMAGIEWADGAATWEEYQTAVDDRAQALRDRQEIEAYQDRLEQGRDRLERGEPLTAEEADSIRRDIEAMPESVRAQRDGRPFPDQSAAPGQPAGSAARQYQGQGIEAGALNPAFAAAAFALKPDDIAAAGIAGPPPPLTKPFDI